MNRNLLVTLLLALCLVLVGIGGAVSSHAGESPPSIEGASVDALVASQLTVQSWYTEGDIPVNGHRDMTFRVHTNDTCTSPVGSNISRPGVSIEDGVFDVLLDVRHEDFDGQALWLKVIIGGVEMDCIPLMPAPYALSLRPGAKISDASSTAKFNRAWSSGQTHYKVGVYGEAIGSGIHHRFIGVHGESSDDTGVYGESDSGIGVAGAAKAGSGLTVGVRGISSSSEGTGVEGFASADSGENYGVTGISASTSGRGVFGWAGATDGQTVGVYGRTDSRSNQARGIFGEATSTGNGITYGVRGESSSTRGRGVLGEAKASSGVAIGVRGESRSTEGRGVFGWANAENGAAFGVYGSSDSPDGAGVYALGRGEHDPDLVLGGRSTSNDNGVIWSDPSYPGSDIFIRSNDHVGIHLDRDGDGEDSSRLYVYNGDGNTIFRLDESGFLRVRNSSEETIFQVNQTGTARVNVLQITGGSDLSERFDISSASGEIRPGLAVCIDADQPGELSVCDGAYNRTVAGIISGAGGIDPGMVMGQEGSQADGAYPVALTGRVYAWADASGGPIRPGDLLTTSGTTGHLMKVTDHGQASGAIVGKAMSSVDADSGLVLVLVTLQ